MESVGYPQRERFDRRLVAMIGVGGLNRRRKERISRRGGGGVDERKGPLWSPAWLMTASGNAGQDKERGRPQGSKVPGTPFHTTPAPTRHLFAPRWADIYWMSTRVSAKNALTLFRKIPCRTTP